MALELILIFFATIIAFWISALCGGGASLILIPILNTQLPATQVPFALTAGSFSSSISRIAIFKKHINWTIVLWFVPFSIPAVLSGAYFIKYINTNYLQIIVAIFLIGNIPQLFRKKESTLQDKKYPQYILAVIGFMAGFVSGITGAVGLLFNRFYLKFGLSKEEIVATRAANEIFLHLIKLITYMLLGLFSKTAIIIGLTISLATIVSSYTVKYILPYISEHLFKKIGYIAMVGSGIFLLISTSCKIIQQDNISFELIHTTSSVGMQMIRKNKNMLIEISTLDGFKIESDDAN